MVYVAVMTRRRVDLRLESDLIARVDAEADRLGQTRTKYVERALQQKLDLTLEPQVSIGRAPVEKEPDGSELDAKGAFGRALEAEVRGGNRELDERAKRPAPGTPPPEGFYGRAGDGLDAVRVVPGTPVTIETIVKPVAPSRPAHNANWARPVR